MVGMCAILPLPGMIENAYRVHRLVVLPDYQGLGIGTKLLKELCRLYTSTNKKMYIRTSHIKLYNYMLNSGDWEETCRSGTQSPQSGVLWKVINDRIAYSFKYVGDNNTILNNKCLGMSYNKDCKTKQMSLFDDFIEE